MHFLQLLSFLLTFQALLVTSAVETVNSLNRWAREGIDMLSGSDGHALIQILDDYFDCQTDSTSLTHSPHQ